MCNLRTIPLNHLWPPPRLRSAPNGTCPRDYNDGDHQGLTPCALTYFPAPITIPIQFIGWSVARSTNKWGASIPSTSSNPMPNYNLTLSVHRKETTWKVSIVGHCVVTQDQIYVGVLNITPTYPHICVSNFKSIVIGASSISSPWPYFSTPQTEQGINIKLAKELNYQSSESQYEVGFLLSQTPQLGLGKSRGFIIPWVIWLPLGLY